MPGNISESAQCYHPPVLTSEQGRVLSLRFNKLQGADPPVNIPETFKYDSLSLSLSLSQDLSANFS